MKRKFDKVYIQQNENEKKIILKVKRDVRNNFV